MPSLQLILSYFECAKMNLWLSKQTVSPLSLHWFGGTKFHHLRTCCTMTSPALDPQTQTRGDKETSRLSERSLPDLSHPTLVTLLWGTPAPSASCLSLEHYPMEVHPPCFPPLLKCLSLWLKWKSNLNLLRKLYLIFLLTFILKLN